MAAKRNISPSEDARMLAMIEEGRTYRDVAILCDVSVGTVVTGVRRAKARRKQAAEPEPPPKPRQPSWVRDMVPMFPIEALMGDLVGEGSRCPHRGPIPRGSMFVCMICHQSGMDDAPDLRRDPLTDPKPEPKPQAKPGPKPNRRQRRRANAA